MRWQQVCAIYEGELKKGSTDSLPTDVFSDNEQGKQRWNDLRNRVVEHVSVCGPNMINIVDSIHL